MTGMFPIPSMRTLAVDCLCVSSNYQELVPRFQKAQQKVCLCSSSFLKSYLTGAVFLVHSRAGDNHNAMDCYTEGIAKPSITKILMERGIKISVFQVERGEGTTGLSYHM